MVCKDCVHKIVIPGSCHIGCNNPNANPERVTWKGCGLYPLNFDPCTIKSCKGYSNNENDKLPREIDAMLELIRLLMPRLDELRIRGISRN